MPSPFYADLHIHSKYSRACSKDCDLEHLAWWARRKGLNIVGTGDFTHPAWFEHLREQLVPAEPGLFRLRDDVATEVDRWLPASCRGPVRFMLSVEIATIYKRAERTRKVHHLIYVPDFAAAERMTRELAKIGNLASDGRPILGLDSRDLLEITLHSDPGSYLVPAHIWTPWFSALGSKSGFDAVADCYADLSEHIFAVETGLSSDPSMNYRVADLDRYRLVSNSDAHSPPMLAREATIFDSALDFYSIRDALRTGSANVGTIEFFPEEGKYHLDGHRKCQLRLHPEQTRTHHEHRCPACGKPLTVGVLHRVEELADRPEGFQPEGADEFHNLVPLPEIIAELRGVGPKTKTVRSEFDALVADLGPELTILRETPIDDIARAGSRLLAEAVTRLRHGDVIREAGYDGEYGNIRLFQAAELKGLGGYTGFTTTPALFPMEEPDASQTVLPVGVEEPASNGQPSSSPRKASISRRHDRTSPIPSRHGMPRDVSAPAPEVAEAGPGSSLLRGLDTDQRVAAASTEGPLLVIAGPGTGKTRVLTHRIAYLMTEGTVPPENCLAVTFTRRACAEMRERLASLVGEASERIVVTTFHGLGVMILREHHAYAGLERDFRVADEAQRLSLAEQVTGSAREARNLLASRAASGDPHSVAEVPGGATEAHARYEKAMRAQGLVDFDDLVSLPLRTLRDNPAVATAYRERFSWICVDEYQDVDERQYTLLRLLTEPDSNLCAIGDPDQAIYGFRGADVGYFLRFQEDYPAARTAVLTNNYRSSPAIVRGAVQLIRPATLVTDRVLHPVQDQSSSAAVPYISLHATADERAEGESVARLIDQLLGGSSFHSLDSGRVGGDDDLVSDVGSIGGATDNADRVSAAGLSFSDIAVLYRTDATARPVMEALTRAGLPFQKRSHDRLADRPGVRQLVRELRYRGMLSTRALRHAADATIEVLSSPDREEEIRTAAELLSPLVERCEGDLDRFLGELSLGAEVDAWDPRADRVSLLTMHAAKGLEFPVVFLVGCEDGLVPLRWPGDSTETDLAEERRLLFVGMTRAQSRLFVSYASRRCRNGASRERTPSVPSPFLDTIDRDLLRTVSSHQPDQRRQRGKQMRLL